MMENVQEPFILYTSSIRMVIICIIINNLGTETNDRKNLSCWLNCNGYG